MVFACLAVWGISVDHLNPMKAWMSATLDEGKGVTWKTLAPGYLETSSHTNLQRENRAFNVELEFLVVSAYFFRFNSRVEVIHNDESPVRSKWRLIFHSHSRRAQPNNRTDSFPHCPHPLQNILFSFPTPKVSPFYRSLTLTCWAWKLTRFPGSEFLPFITLRNITCIYQD
jgi:hypothetical protein